MTRPPLAGEAERVRLRMFVRYDLAALVAAAAFLATIRAGPVRNDWIEAILLALLALAVCLVRANAMATAGRYVPAVLLVTIANWATIVAATAIAPYAFDIVPVVVLLPTLLAVPYLSGPQLAALNGATIVVAVVLALCGRLAPGGGLEESAPAWLLDSFTVLFLPVMVGLVAFLAWQNHLVMSAQTRHLMQSQEQLAAAIADERQRIERSLRDGTQRRLAAAREQLRVIQRLLTSHPDRVGHLLDTLVKQVQDANAELRELTHGIYPPELAEHGIEAAVRTAARHSPVPATLRVTGLARYPPEVEATVYFCCTRGLQMAGTRGAAQTTIELTDNGDLSFRVWQSGLEGDQPARAEPAVAAYQDITDRVHAVGGTVRVTPAAERGLLLHGHIPAAARPEDPSRPFGRRGSAYALLARLWYYLGTQWGRLGHHDTADHHDTAEQSAVIGIKALSTVAAGSLAFIAAALVVVPHVALLVLAALAALAWALLRYALRMARQGKDQAAILAAVAIFWAYPLASTVLIPVTICFTPIVMVIPAILAAPHPRHRFRVTLAATIAAVIAVALAGSLLPGAGVQERAPEWFSDLTLIALTVINTVLALFFAWENHRDLATRAQALHESRRRLVAATDRERRRIERNLHDGAQQRLIAAAVDLRVAQRLLTSHPHQVVEGLDELAEQLRQASVDLRDLTYDIFPPELIDGGLATALRAAVKRSPTSVMVHATALRRYPPEIELSVYFCCLEALQNAAKHAGVTASVTISLADHDGLTFDVRDTGPGCDPDALRAGHGIANMHDRLNAVGGALTIHTEPGAGVHVHGHVPRR